MDQYCFTVHGHALKHGIEERTQFQVLTVRTATSTTLKNSEYFRASRPSMNPSSKELTPPNPPYTIQALVIGIAPFIPDLDVSKMWTPPNTRKGKSMKGKDLLAQEPENAVDMPEAGAWRVVIEVGGGKDINSMTKLYALANPKRGLSTPYIINQNEVYYFSEFVSSETSRDKRAAVWNQRAKEAAGYGHPDELKIEKNGDPTRFITSGEMSLANSLVILTTLFNQNPQLWMLAELKKLLEVSDDDLKYKHTSFEALFDFFEPDERWIDGAEVPIMQQMTIYWPEVADTIKGLPANDALPEDDRNDTPARYLRLLKKGLVRSKLFIPYRLQRSFFVLAAMEWKRTPPRNKKDELASFVTNIKLQAELVVGQADQGGTSRPSISDGGWAVCLAMKNTLQKMIDAGDRTTHQLVALNGSQANISSSDDAEADVPHPTNIFHKFKDAADSDTANLALGQTARVPFIAAMVQLEKCYRDPAEKMVNLLNKCNLREETESEDGDNGSSSDSGSGRGSDGEN